MQLCQNRRAGCHDHVRAQRVKFKGGRAYRRRLGRRTDPALLDLQVAAGDLAESAQGVMERRAVLLAFGILGARAAHREHDTPDPSGLLRTRCDQGRYCIGNRPTGPQNEFKSFYVPTPRNGRHWHGACPSKAYKLRVCH